MKRLTERIFHYVTLAIITAVAVGVGWRMTMRRDLNKEGSALDVRPLPLASLPKAPVTVVPVDVGICEVTVAFAGKIEPWETYSVGFEVPGRVLSLGENSESEPLDEGDRVEAGQILARLDDRVFRAQRAEAVARVEQAASDLDRARRVQRTNPSAVSETELQQFVTNEALARAQSDIATKNLEDAILRAPVAATVSRRMIKAGESVGAHQVVFELVEDDDVLLVFHVPESQVAELARRQREVRANRAKSSPAIDPEDLIFRAHVRLEGTDLFGRARSQLDGVVYRIGQVADPRTSLFDVEVLLSNRERLLRPGMVATARMVTRRLRGYSLPAECVMYRQNEAQAFTLSEHEADLEMLYWNLGPTSVFRARRVQLDRWVDQGATVIVPEDAVELSSVIVRGHHRLSDGQLVRPTQAVGSEVPGVALGAASTATSLPESPQAPRGAP